MSVSEGIVLVVGGTGKLGTHIVKQLISKGNKVRLISRSKTSAENNLGSDLLNSLEGLIECDLYSEAQILRNKIEGGKNVKSILEQAFEDGAGGQKVVAVISSLRANLNRKEDSYLIEVVAVKILCQLAVRFQVKKFILVSSYLASRPYNPIAFLTNMFGRDSIVLKVEAENAVRESGLGYIIARPGILVDLENEITSTIGQESDVDARKKQATRETFADTLVQVYNNSNVGNQIIFECSMRLYMEYRYFTVYSLAQDDQSTTKKIIKCSSAKNIYQLSFFTLCLGTVRVAYWLSQKKSK